MTTNTLEILSSNDFKEISKKINQSFKKKEAVRNDYKINKKLSYIHNLKKLEQSIPELINF